jgi:hypothetical protein
MGVREVFFDLYIRLLCFYYWGYRMHSEGLAVFPSSASSKQADVRLTY